VFVVFPGTGVKTLKEYLALGKSQPNTMTFASGGTGSITQLLGTKINMATGLQVREIPYKAIGAELPDLMAGHVATAYLAPVVVAQHIRSGKLIALGVAGSKRIPILPEVPTLAEAGLPDVEASLPAPPVPSCSVCKVMWQPSWRPPPFAPMRRALAMSLAVKALKNSRLTSNLNCYVGAR
jgi:tripartite-type tricarboxylate transporter receptor subunit TctC